MAEGFTCHLKGDTMEAYSAGIAPKGVDPRAVKVMSEAGVDISGHTSNHVDDFRDMEFDYVITVCGHANENCPLFPGKTKVIHRGFEDPPQLAAESATEEEALSHYRRVRDEIKDFIASLPQWLKEQDSNSIDIKLQ